MSTNCTEYVIGGERIISSIPRVYRTSLPCFISFNPVLGPRWPHLDSLVPSRTYLQDIWNGLSRTYLQDIWNGAVSFLLSLLFTPLPLQLQYSTFSCFSSSWNAWQTRRKQHFWVCASGRQSSIASTPTHIASIAKVFIRSTAG